MRKKRKKENEKMNCWNIKVEFKMKFRKSLPTNTKMNIKCNCWADWHGNYRSDENTEDVKSEREKKRHANERQNRAKVK